MAERMFKTYGLSGTPETRLEQEFDQVYKMVPAMDVKTAAPNVNSMEKNKPVLVLTGGILYIYVRVNDTRYKAQLTAG